MSDDATARRSQAQAGRGLAAVFAAPIIGLMAGGMRSALGLTGYPSGIVVFCLPLVLGLAGVVLGIATLAARRGNISGTALAVGAVVLGGIEVLFCALFLLLVISSMAGHPM